MKDVTTVQLRKSVVRELKAVKKYPQQTYNEIIMESVDQAKAVRTRKGESQYDEFLHSIQQLKMKELWDNEEDKGWKNA